MDAGGRVRTAKDGSCPAAHPALGRDETKYLTALKLRSRDSKDEDPVFASTERRYVLLFDKQRTDEAVRQAMAVRMVSP